MLQYNTEDSDFIISGSNIMLFVLTEGFSYVSVTLCVNYSNICDLGVCEGGSVTWCVWLQCCAGLVFLQYRNETKRALLPNEITSIDTVKALFVRSFPKQLTMEYLDSPHVKIYIHDSSKDMFYELEDLRFVYH